MVGKLTNKEIRKLQKEGHKACKNGIAMNACPYEDDKRQQWLIGYEKFMEEHSWFDV